MLRYHADLDDVDWAALLEEAAETAKPLVGSGRVAQYIPALARVSPNQFGMAIRLVDGREFSAGGATTRFTVQSVSKVFTLGLALETYGPSLWQRVGREPSGQPFNSLVQLEYEKGKPRNPLINAGAIVVADALCQHFAAPDRAILDLMRRLTLDPGLRIDEEVYESEEAHGDLNRAIAYFLKAHGNLRNDVPAVTRAYFRQCSILVSCLALARALTFLADGGMDASGRRLIDPDRAQRINAVMATCGLYDAVGEFMFRVGLPGKSGVSGAIVAVIPGLMSIAAWSPGLDEHGNSVAAAAALERFSHLIRQRIYSGGV